jgi:hypothetical protein
MSSIKWHALRIGSGNSPHLELIVTFLQCSSSHRTLGSSFSQVQSEKRSPEKTRFTQGSRAAQAKMFVHKDFDKVIQFMSCRFIQIA